MFSSRTRREVKVFKNERQTMENIQKNQVGMALFLSAYIHQGDDLFSAQSRGKQCAFMSLSAILTAENMPLIDWSKTTFNNVLILQGDKMYLRALNNGLIVLEPSIEFLSVDNLPKVVGVSCCRNMFSYEIDLMSQTISSAQSNINNLPCIVVESNIDLPIVVEPIEAQKKSDLPIVVEPIEAQNTIDLPIVAEAVDVELKFVATNETNNENQIWLISY
jgi:hypothetical protein